MANTRNPLGSGPEPEETAKQIASLIPSDTSEAMMELKALSPEAGSAIISNVTTRVILDEAHSVAPSSPEKMDHMKRIRKEYVDKPKSE